MIDVDKRALERLHFSTFYLSADMKFYVSSWKKIVRKYSSTLYR